MHSLLCGLTPERIVYSLALLHRSEPDFPAIVGVADPPGSSIADGSQTFPLSGGCSMDAKQRRRRFAQNCRSSVYRVHAKALAGGMTNPIVLVLDLRDRLACEFALSVMTPEKLAKKIAVDTRNELAPMLVFPLPSDEAAAL